MKYINLVYGDGQLIGTSSGLFNTAAEAEASKALHMPQVMGAFPDMAIVCQTVEVPPIKSN